MDKKKFTLNATVDMYDSKVNDGFAKVKILVNTHEQVANGTKFSKELLSSKMNGLNYLPIVAEFKKEKNDFGTHGGKIELSDEGIEWIDTTMPYGVIIENSGRFEDVEKPNGESIEYVVCDGYVWVDRYPELNVLFEGKSNNQSMEIKVVAGNWDDQGVYCIEDFEYSALCILGKDVTPAFNLAKIEANFEAKDFKAQYSEMLSALEKYLATTTSENEVENVEDTDTKVEETFKEETVEDTTEQSEVKNETPKSEEVDMAQDDDGEIDYVKAYMELHDKYDVLEIRFTGLKNEFNEYKSTHSTPDEEVELLKEYQSTKLAEERKLAEEEIFSQFKELEGNEEFEVLKQKASEFTLEQLEKEVTNSYK